MNLYEMLDELQIRALHDETIRDQFLITRGDPTPVSAFCKKCQELGYPIYEMDLIHAGEAFHASMKRSTNGGGENSPALTGEDDFYEQFFTVLEK